MVNEKIMFLGDVQNTQNNSPEETKHSKPGGELVNIIKIDNLHQMVGKQRKAQTNTPRN